jgi:4-carboxymuconolactone decarboxylase
MPRIPYVDISKAAPTIQEALAGRRPLNIFRMLPHAEPAASGFLALGSALRWDNTLDPVVRELVIVRTGILCRADYEVHQHKQWARHVGVSEEKIAALHDGPDAPVFTDDERKILRYVDQVVLNVKAGDSTFAAVAELLSHRQLVELTLLIGFYTMVSRFLENFEVELEDAALPIVTPAENDESRP